jgi:hypothetical protein
MPKLTPVQEAQRQKFIVEARARHEQVRRAAIRINDLADSIHSEADARSFIDAVAQELSGHRHLLWTALGIRHRVANAEWQAVSNSSSLIPEARIVDVWNEYVREIDAPEDALISVFDLHEFRVKDFEFSRHNWKLDLTQSLWSMPNVYALHPDGTLADGCRALETLKLVHNMHNQFFRLQFARARLQNAIPAFAPTQPRPFLVDSHFQPASSLPDVIRPAMIRYQREHGMDAYNQLLRRLFEELFPRS